MKGKRKTPKHVQIPLREELAAFELRRAEWIAAGLAGKWVAMRAGAILSFYPDMSAAYAAGLRAFGCSPFLVKEVCKADEQAIVHRMSPSRKGA